MGYNIDSEDKIFISEEIYKIIKDNVASAIEDSDNSGLRYAFRVYGELEGKRNVYLCEAEECKLKNIRNLNTVNGDEMDIITEQSCKGRYYLSTVIFHVKSENDSEDFIKQYLRRYNFYISRVTLLPTIIVIDSKTKKFTIEIYENLIHSERFVKKESELFIRTKDNKNIPIEQYDRIELEDNITK